MINLRSFHLGTAFVDPMRCVIRIDGADKHIEPQVMSVLMRLVDEPGEVITRAQLLQSAWPDTIVNDGALSKAISVLRRALGDKAKHPHFIETIPKIGYRLIAPVKEVAVAAYEGGSLEKAPSVPLEINVHQRDRAPRQSVLGMKVREMTVGQVLLMVILLGVLFIFWPRQEFVELEEEIRLVRFDGTEHVISDSSWTTKRSGLFSPESRPFQLVTKDTLIVKKEEAP
ncbi:MAG: winged helix-turn-helix domain-containing protein [Rhodothermaceae bacterium]|nr:winged helix-turn-helix domain-containing protein [Rhodothermaceae bacterium]